ncbi:hypothetical protein NDU88_001665 [Pleurodeles waltl]|uniref:Uncharacterized protein n=1 Tax=Pleurodeles waltl TaxID=8319 RepID=A0AAV7MQJ0_PLEWA|nr:hypothetical protein NDU88_001665 [Pleurodeles waltl]
MRPGGPDQLCLSTRSPMGSFRRRNASGDYLLGSEYTACPRGPPSSPAGHRAHPPSPPCRGTPRLSPGHWNRSLGLAQQRDRRDRSGTKPTKAQSVEERTRLLQEATQFASNPYSALNALPDTAVESTRADSSDAGDSHQSPSLTPRSADDI